MIRLLFCGDVVGRSGREAFAKYVPLLRKELKLDVVVVNGENAAHGFGINGTICRELYANGADIITTGNHVWDQRDLLAYIPNDKRLVRPSNYPAGTPGLGSALFTTARGHKVIVINVMGRLFMDPLDDPFLSVDTLLKQHSLGGSVHGIVVDIHAEATSEKMAMGHFCDGRASLVVGTHTHVPTSDAQILPGGTAYQTDAGMCGDYLSVVGMEKTIPLFKFTRKLPPPERMQPATGPGTLCGTFVCIDPETGCAISIESIQVGGRLKTLLPIGITVT